MPLTDFYAESIDANLQRELQTPKPPPGPPSFSAWSFAAAGIKGLPAAGLEVTANLLDINSLLSTKPADFTQGRAVRAAARDFAPDPETSTTADQVVHGLTKSLAKGVGYIATMGGVPGAVAFGADEGNTTAQNLIAKGVDTGTAAKVGAATGAFTALGAAMPVAGSTIGRTAALAAVGGPGTFMGQEQAARSILQNAGYPDEAKLHDPTDPLGLALSIAVPGAAGVLHLRAKARAAKLEKPLRTEADVRAAAGLTPAEQAASDAFERSAGNLAELRAAIKAEKNPANRATLEAELAKQEAAARDHAGEAAARVHGQDPATVDAARVRVTEDHLAATLPDTPNARAEMLRAADAIGAGEAPRLEVPAPWELPRTLADVPAAHQMADDLRGMAQGAYWAQEGGKLIRTGLDEAGDGGMGGAVAGRTPWVAADEWFGRMRSQLGRDGLSSQSDIQAAVEKAVSGQKLRAAEQRTIDWMRTEVDEMRMQAMRHGLDEDLAHIAAQEGLGHGLSRADAEDLALTTRAAQIDEAAVERAALAHENDDAAFMAEMRRIIADGQEAAPQPSGITSPGAGARGALDGSAPQAATGRNALPGPEEVGGQTAEAQTSTGTAPVDTARVDSLLAEQPDLRVTLPGHEGSMSIAEALELTKAEAAVLKQDAELVRAAVACALENGAALA